MKALLLALFFFFSSPVIRGCDCFQFLLEKGKETFHNRQFSTALQKFTAARDCPDRPKITDLEDWIRKTQQSLGEQKVWNRARNADSPEAYQRYLDNYPNGYYQRLADLTLVRLKNICAQPVQEVMPNGNINWTQEYVEAKGQCVIDTSRFHLPAQAILMATRGAEVVAKANLLETAGGVHIQRSTTVRDMVTGSDVVRSKVHGIVKGTRMIGEPMVADGLVTVTLRIPVFGPGSVAAAVTPVSPWRETPVDLPDSTGEVLILRLHSATRHFAMYPSFADEQGSLLLDGTAFSQQHAGECLVRYVQPETLPADTRLVDISEDTHGRWVLPATALPDFQYWLGIRLPGGGAAPIWVIL
ncbi:MAG: hypothetical protein ABIQ93_10125 [Saprospiraceae bacterium]